MVTCRLTSLDLHEAPLVEVMPEVLDDLGSRLECLAGGVVQDEIKITLTVSHLLVLKAKGKLVKTRCEEDNIFCEDTEFSGITVLGVGTSRVANDADPISSSE